MARLAGLGLPQLQAVAMEAAARRVLQVGLRRLQPEPDVGVQLRRRGRLLERRARRLPAVVAAGVRRERRRRRQHRQQRHLPQLHLAAQRRRLLVLVDLYIQQNERMHIYKCNIITSIDRACAAEQHKQDRIKPEEQNEQYFWITYHAVQEGVLVLQDVFLSIDRSNCIQN